MKYGGSNKYVKKGKVYQSKEVPEFVRFDDTTTKSIHRYEDERLQNGIYRYIDSTKIVEYGTIIFAKEGKNGEEEMPYLLKKYPSGEIEYQEDISILGQGKGWRTLTKYKFIPQKLDWEKVIL